MKLFSVRDQPKTSILKSKTSLDLTTVPLVKLLTELAAVEVAEEPEVAEEDTPEVGVDRLEVDQLEVVAEEDTLLE